MKFNLKGIRFNTWLYFLGFSISMLLILGFLLVVLIKPYYRNDRINMIDNISNTIEETLIKNEADEKAVDNAARMVMGNNVCALIYNENGKEVYSSDSLGQLCMFNRELTINDEKIVIEKEPQKIIGKLKEKRLFSNTYTSDLTDTDMILYGKQIKSNLANYYLLINTPIEPVESYVDFILNQYLYIAIIIVAIALVVSFVLANRISSPIVKMKNEANKLAEGDYNASFKSDSFSEINDLANTLDDATEKLSKVNELRKDLVANVSHDIKTPLTMIKAYAEMIKDISGDDPEKREEHLNVILKEADYLDKLVTDMQELSKLQSGNIELNKSNFDLLECAEEVSSLLGHLMNEKRITLVKNLTSVTVYADEIKISQVIYNFLSNAIKHSFRDSKVEMTIIDSEDSVRFEVKDYGEGIKEKDLPYIWDRYYKIDKNFDRSIESTGLGLAIVKAILETHKASYGVISKEGEGSMFYFELSKDYEENED